MTESSVPTDVFPERLKTAREARGLSQGELAEKTGLQPSAVSHFETGSRKPSFDNLRRLADALKVTTDYLLGRSRDMEGTGLAADRLHRHYSGLTADYQEMADEFMRMLADKAKAKRRQDE